MYNKESTMSEYKIAVDDANKALAKRPKDKFYNQHKQDLDVVILNYINKKATFIKELVEKAEYALEIKKKIQKRKQQMMEESKGVAVDIEKEEEEKEFEYPEECKVLDIMKEKYHDAI